MPNDDTRTPPVKFMLLEYGEKEYTIDGKTGRFDFDEAAADRIIAEFTARNRDLVIDFEHATLSGEPAPAAGWIDRLEKTSEGLTAHVKYWTDKASNHLADGEYRYFSPTLLFGPDGGVAAIHSVALTNHPALHGVAALVANDLTAQPPVGTVPTGNNQTQEIPMNDKLLAALQNLLGDPALALSDDSAATVAKRLTALADELPTLRSKAAKCDELLAEAEKQRKLALFDAGAKRGAFCNAQKDTLLKLSLADLEELEKATPDNAAFPAQQLPKPAEDDKKKIDLTDEERAIARKMNLSDEEFAEIKKKLENQETEETEEE